MRGIRIRKIILFTVVLMVGLLPLIVRGESVKDSHSQRGDDYLQKEKYRKAISEYKKAIKIDPNDADVYHNLGLAYERLRKYRQAIQNYGKALEVGPDDAVTFYNMGVAYGELGKHREAIEYYEKSLQIDPNKIEVYNNLGVIYNGFGEYKEAIEYYEKVLQIDPNNTNAYYNVGCVKRNLNQHQEAVKYFQKALEIDPSYVKAYNNLGETYSKLGQRQKSKESYQMAKALSAMPTNPNYIPVTNLSERIPGGLGLSILPPQQKGWYIVKKSPIGGLNFVRIGTKPTQTYHCAIYVIPVDRGFKNPDDFLEFVKQSKGANTDPKRYKNVESSYNLNKRYSSYCVECQMKCTDIKPKTIDRKPLIFKIYGYSFIHPKSSEYMIDIQYSDRGEGKDFTPSFQKVANEFIDNLLIE